MKNKGFTLIELLVVVAIIGVLATVVLGSLSSARVKAQDTKRIAIVKQLETALEMYHLDKGEYPRRYVYSCCGVGADNPLFNIDLSPYMKIDVNDPLFGPSNELRYRSRSGSNYQTYGIGVALLDPSNSNLKLNDGGYFNQWYEIGQDPVYCKNKYITTGADWVHSNLNRCVGGN